jgi:23S rRNA (cytidine1920-2'-O)/16S rRNA (cytidine1409-2'-O)-methyltransferase
VSGLCHDRRVSQTTSTTAAKVGRSRLDELLVERGLASSRTRAQALILAGQVRVGEGDAARLDRKAGDLVASDTPVAVTERDPYVSRGGHKLAAALDAFVIDPAGRICLDAGASTGGFTDVLLQRGATRVYAVDVGRGQLAESLRQDERVVSLERTNARSLTPSSLPEPIDLTVIDVSFISLGLVLGPIASTLRPGSDAPIVALVKPQFEAGRGRTDHGVVRDPAIHREVLERVVETAQALGLGARAVIASPILGPEGNREFFLHLQAGPGCSEIGELIVVVSGA